MGRLDAKGILTLRATEAARRKHRDDQEHPNPQMKRSHTVRPCALVAPVSRRPLFQPSGQRLPQNALVFFFHRNPMLTCLLFLVS
jgi:hypothetical protein